MAGILRISSSPTGLTANYKHNAIPSSVTGVVDVHLIPREEESALVTIVKLVGPDMIIEPEHRDVILEIPLSEDLVELIVASLQAEGPEA